MINIDTLLFRGMFMLELSKEERRRMKSFDLKSKDEFIIYLQELIGRTYKCIRKHKRYLERLDSYIETLKNKEDDKEIKISEEVYGEFTDLLSSIECYVLNLIGDHQQSSMSYKKFRDLIDKRKKRGTIDFEIRELDQTVIEYLNELNKIRNWANHVPESLLTSEIRLIQEGKLKDHSRNPIIITIDQYYSLEYLMDLYETSSNFNKVIVSVHQSMKKDYSSLIGESMNIVKNYTDKPRGIEFLEATKLSGQVQELKGSLKNK